MYLAVASVGIFAASADVGDGSQWFHPIQPGSLRPQVGVSAHLSTVIAPAASSTDAMAPERSRLELSLSESISSELADDTTTTSSAFNTREVLTRAEVERLVSRLAPVYELDSMLVLALIEAESSFRVDARSSKNARGLMQLMPATAKRFGVTDIDEPIENLQEAPDI